MGSLATLCGGATTSENRMLCAICGKCNVACKRTCLLCEYTKGHLYWENTEFARDRDLGLVNIKDYGNHEVADTIIHHFIPGPRRGCTKTLTNARQVSHLEGCTFETCPRD